jgi:hypothetical protein
VCRDRLPTSTIGIGCMLNGVGVYKVLRDGDAIIAIK